MIGLEEARRVRAAVELVLEENDSLPPIGTEADLAFGKQGERGAIGGTRVGGLEGVANKFSLYVKHGKGTGERSRASAAKVKRAQRHARALLKLIRDPDLASHLSVATEELSWRRSKLTRLVADMGTFEDPRLKRAGHYMTKRGEIEGAIVALGHLFGTHYGTSPWVSDRGLFGIRYQSWGDKRRITEDFPEQPVGPLIAFVQVGLAVILVDAGRSVDEVPEPTTIVRYLRKARPRTPKTWISPTARK